jgi:hypothetical protein
MSCEAILPLAPQNLFSCMHACQDFITPDLLPTHGSSSKRLYKLIIYVQFRAKHNVCMYFHGTVINNKCKTRASK